MSLCRKLQIQVIVIFVVALFAAIKINHDSVNNLAVVQLSQTTRNIEELLEQFISVEPIDRFGLTAEIDTLFNRGDFEKIALLKQDGEVVYKRQKDAMVDNIQLFLQKYLTINLHEKAVQIYGNGIPFGLLKVKLQPDPFYNNLWLVIKRLCFIFLMMAVLSLIAIGVTIRPFLDALQGTTVQIEGVEENKYLLIENLPRQPELKKVALAMNKMVEKIQSVFNGHLEDLKHFKQMQFVDCVTGLNNRNYLVKQLRGFLDSDTETANGHFAMLAISGMETYNISLGHPQIQSIYKGLANILIDEVKKIDNAVAARLSQQEFGIIWTDCSQQQALELTGNAISQISDLISDRPELKDFITISCGIAFYKYNDDAGDVLSKADYALSKAKHKPTGSIEIFTAKENQPIMGKYQWQIMLYSALVNEQFLLMTQAVTSASAQLHREVYINFSDSHGKVYKAGYFMPMAISLGLASRLDKYVLERVAEYLKKNAGEVLAVNLTTSFCIDRTALVWLRQFLDVNSSLKDNLFFEINDNSFIQHPEICFDFVKVLKQMKFNFGLDQFSLSEASLNYLNEIKPYYIKIEQDYFQNLEKQCHCDVALNALLTITNNLDIKLIVTKIEDPKLHQALLERKIEYFQGYAIADIIPLKIT